MLVFSPGARKAGAVCSSGRMRHFLSCDSLSDLIKSVICCISQREVGDSSTTRQIGTDWHHRGKKCGEGEIDVRIFADTE